MSNETEKLCIDCENYNTSTAKEPCQSCLLSTLQAIGWQPKREILVLPVVEQK